MPFSRRDLLKGAAASVPAISVMPALAGAPETHSKELPGNALLRDDFSHLPSGWLTYPLANQGPAIQENQWLDARAHAFGNWSNGVADQDAWMVSMEPATGKSYMMQLLHHPPHKVSAVLVAGEPEWVDYDYEVMVRPLSFDGVVGIAFRYQTNLQYYLLALTGGDKVELRVQHLETKVFREPNWETVASAKFAYDTKTYYKLRVENRGAGIKAFIDGSKVLEISDAIYPGGKVGLCGDAPVRFMDARADSTRKADIAAQIHAREERVRKLQANNPQPRLWKKFSTEGFGAASNIKFGDLNGDGVPEFLIAQNIQTVDRDAFDQISCLTAVTAEGKVLWQSGKPNPRNALLTNDNPFQIHDIDGDGKPEVICIRDFQIQILDGQNGKLKKWCWTPEAPQLEAKHSANTLRPYELVFGDSLFLCNVSGDRNRTDILIKDRYLNFWIFDKNLKFLWHGTGQTGHCPYFFDVDGYDRIMIGYSMWDHTGKQLWSHDKDIHDHADSVAVVNMSADPNAAPQVYSTGSDEGYLRFSYDGKILTHQMIGHAQASSIGKFRPEMPGLQFMMVDFHWNPGIILQYDGEGNRLHVAEPIHNGSKMLPVNWRGDGQEFILLSGDPKYGGLMDGNFDRAVMFPNDGHPDMASFVLDMTGDGRDDIVFWDPHSVWIYTQDRPFTGDKLYVPKRNPLYNMSNYSLIVSEPAWKTVTHAPKPAVKK